MSNEVPACVSGLSPRDRPKAAPPSSRFVSDAEEAAFSDDKVCTSSSSDDDVPPATLERASHQRPAAAGTQEPKYYIENEFGNFGARLGDSSDDSLDGSAHKLFANEADVDVSALICGGSTVHCGVYTSVVTSTQDDKQICVKVLHVPDCDDPVAAREVCNLMLSSCRRQMVDLSHRELPLVLPFELQEPERLMLVTLSQHLLSLIDVTAFRWPMSDVELRSCAAGLVTSVACLHDHGMFHGNIKPSNVMLARDGSVLLADAAGLLCHPLLCNDFSTMTTEFSEWLHQRDEIHTGSLTSSLLQGAISKNVPSAAGDWKAVATVIMTLADGYPPHHGLGWRDAARRVLSDATTCHVGDSGTELQSLLHLLRSGQACSENVLQHPFIDVPDCAANRTALAKRAARTIDSIFSDGHLPAETATINLVRNSLLSLRMREPQYKSNASHTIDAMEHTTPQVLSVVVPDGSSIVVNDLESQHARGVVAVTGASQADVAVCSQMNVVIVADVTDSTIALGPCNVALLANVARCRVSVAAHTVVVSSCVEVEVACSTIAPIQVVDEDTALQISVTGYNIAYPGLTRHFDAQHMPRLSRVSCQVDAWSATELQLPSGAGHDAPWAVALPELALTFRDSSVVLLPGEVTGRDVNINGAGTGDPQLLLLLDVMHDVLIRDIHHSLLVIAAAESVALCGVVDCDVFVVAGRITLCDCHDVRVSARRDSGVSLTSCCRVDVAPLLMRAPQLRALTSAVLSTGEWSGEVRDVATTADCVAVRTTHATQDGRGPLDVSVVGRSTPEFLTGSPSAAGVVPLSAFRVAPSTLIAGLVNAMVIRPAGCLFPGVGSDDERHRQLTIDRVAGGVIHVADGVHELCVTDCSGPLEIAVAAAARIKLVRCTNVTLHSTCGSITISACHWVTACVYTNTPPIIHADCVGVQVTTANLATLTLDDEMDRVGVQRSPNLCAAMRIVGQIAACQWPDIVLADEARGIPIAIVGPPPEGVVIGDEDDVAFLDFVEDSLQLEEAACRKSLSDYLVVSAEQCLCAVRGGHIPAMFSATPAALWPTSGAAADPPSCASTVSRRELEVRNDSVAACRMQRPDPALVQGLLCTSACSAQLVEAVALAAKHIEERSAARDARWLRLLRLSQVQTVLGNAEAAASLP